MLRWKPGRWTALDRQRPAIAVLGLVAVLTLAAIVAPIYPLWLGASWLASGESKRQSSTCVAFSEKSAKLTPVPSQVAPRG